MILMFGAVSLYSSMLLADLYRYPGPEEGRRNPTYMDCVRSFLGEHQYQILCLYLLLCDVILLDVIATLDCSAPCLRIGNFQFNWYVS